MHVSVRATVRACGDTCRCQPAGHVTAQVEQPQAKQGKELGQSRHSRGTGLEDGLRTGGRRGQKMFPGVVRRLLKLVPTLLQAVALVVIVHVVGQVS